MRKAGRIAPVVLLAFACTDPPSVASLPPSVTDVTVVYDSAMLASLPYLQHSLVWSTGHDSSATSIEFQKITDIAANEAGTIYVLDIGAGVRMFSKEGLLISSFGPMGPGPAELTNPRSIAVGGDTVFVLDNHLKLFHTSGVYLDQITAQNLEFMQTSRIEYTDSGLALQRRWFESRAGAGAGAGAGGQTTRVYHDSLHIFVKDVAHDLRQVIPAQTFPMLTYVNGSFMGPPLLMDRARVTVSQDAHLYIPDQQHFLIDVRSTHGALLERIVGRVPQVPTSNGDVEDLVRSLRNANNYDDLRYRQTLRQFKSVERAKFRPALGALVVSRSGYVLVERPDLGTVPFNYYDPGSKRVWLLIDPDWTPVAYVTLPGRFRPSVFSGCTIIGYETDDSNAHLLVRYDIVPPPSSALCSNHRI